MNDLEARLERLAAQATKDATAPDVQVIMQRGRRRRALSGPVLAGTVALAVVLAAVVALAAVRGRTVRPPVGPAPTTPPTTAPASTIVSADGWKTYTDAAHNLRLRYPPDWVVRRRHQEGTVTLAPPEQARRMLARWPPLAVTVTAGGGYYIGEAPEPGMTGGRLPAGQAYLRFQTDPAQMVEIPGMPKPAPNVADRPRTVHYLIDWGRDCKGMQPTAVDRMAWSSPSTSAMLCCGTATSPPPRRSSAPPGRSPAPGRPTATAACPRAVATSGE
jgi:hypothetical protein